MPSSCKKRRRLSKSKRRELRRRQAQLAQRSRQKLQHHLEVLPQQARSFFDLFAFSFTKPTFLRFVLLSLSAILTVGCRTTANLLRTLGALAPGDSSAYRRFFCQSRWSAASLARTLAGWVFDRLCPPGPILLAADDTVSEHPGDKVHGKSCHRDAVRSSHSFTAFRWGHKWLVLAVLVRFPWTRRYWALPILVVLLRSQKDDLKANGKHRSPAEVLKLMLFLLRRWFPQRAFLLAADGGYASHDLARFAARQPRDRLGFVSRFYANAALHEPAPEVQLTARGKKPNGRPRVKGAKLDTPQQAVAKSARTPLVVAWYGGGQRRVEVVQGTGHWFKSGHGLVEVRWVFVHDLDGTHRDEYFFSTDVTLTAQTIIETYGRRWNLETTFEEMRSYVGLETTRGWCQKTVERAEPLLFGLYTVVACLYHLMPESERSGGIKWAGKEQLTFSDAMTSVRRWLWRGWVFAAAGHGGEYEKLPESFAELLLNGLAPAA